jgi:hypothetical protein
LRANRSIDRRANVQLVDILEMISGMWNLEGKK